MRKGSKTPLNPLCGRLLCASSLSSGVDLREAMLGRDPLWIMLGMVHPCACWVCSTRVRAGYVAPVRACWVCSTREVMLGYPGVYMYLLLGYPGGYNGPARLPG